MLKKLTNREVGEKKKEFAERTAHFMCHCGPICRVTCNYTPEIYSDYSAILLAIHWVI